MSLADQTNILRIINIVLSILMIAMYGIALFKTKMIKVVAKLQLTKIALLFLFATIIAKAVFNIAIYYFLVFQPQDTVTFSFAANLTNIIINISLILDVLLIATIMDKQ